MWTIHVGDAQWPENRLIGLGLMGGPMAGRSEEDRAVFMVAALEDAGSPAKAGMATRKQT